MALPWKKSRVSKITRIVADLHAPSRDNSLVVQTGFPTSLIDLFVKNKDRFRKPSRNKTKRKLHKQQELTKECDYEEELVKEVDILSGYVCDGTEIQESGRFEQRSEIIDDRCELMVTRDQSCSFNQAVNGNSSENQPQRRVLVLSVLKLFVAMVLALSTKRLTVGIVMSAFVLMLLENVGKHLSCFSKPYSKVIQKVFCVFGDLINVKPLRDEKNSCRDMLQGALLHRGEEEMRVSVSSSCGIGNVESTSFEDEIQAVESDTNTVAPVEENKKIEMDLHAVKTAACDDGNDKIGTLISGKRESRCSRIKSKIVRKFATQKLRGKKRKECKDKEPAGDESKPILTRLIREHTEEVKEVNRKEASISTKGVWRCMSGFHTTGENEFHPEIRRTRSTGSRATVGSFVVKKVVDRRMDTIRKGNSGFLVLLPVILFGLVGGRILSLMVTISSCFIFAYIWRSKRSVDKNTSEALCLT